MGGGFLSSGGGEGAVAFQNVEVCEMKRPQLALQHVYGVQRQFVGGNAPPFPVAAPAAKDLVVPLGELVQARVVAGLAEVERGAALLVWARSGSESLWAVVRHSCLLPGLEPLAQGVVSGGGTGAAPFVVAVGFGDPFKQVGAQGVNGWG